MRFILFLLLVMSPSAYAEKIQGITVTKKAPRIHANIIVRVSGVVEPSKVSRPLNEKEKKDEDELAENIGADLPEGQRENLVKRTLRSIGKFLNVKSGTTAKAIDGDEPDEAALALTINEDKQKNATLKAFRSTLGEKEKKGEKNFCVPPTFRPFKAPPASNKDEIRCGAYKNSGIPVQATEWGWIRTQGGDWRTEKSAYSTNKAKKYVDIHQCQCALPARLVNKDQQWLELTRTDKSGVIHKTKCQVTDVGPWNVDDPYWENDVDGILSFAQLKLSAEWLAVHHAA